MLQPDQERVIQERDELDARLGRLREFVKSNAFENLNVHEKLAMTDQSLHMNGYLIALNRRIAMFIK